MNITGDDDWTPAIGLRRVFIALVWRSVICVPIWAALIWLVTPGLNYVPMHWAWFAMLGLLLAMPGVSIGHALARGLIDRAGFVSPVITAIAAVFAWAAIVAGVEIADQLRPLHDWRSGFAKMATGVFATLWIIKATLLED